MVFVLEGGRGAQAVDSAVGMEDASTERGPLELLDVVC